MSYEARIDYIKGNEICNEECSNLEICILTKNSFGLINGWFDSQCKYLPSNFDSIRNKYNERRDQSFIIYSKRIQMKSSASQIFNDFKYFYFLVLLIITNAKIPLFVQYVSIFT